MPNFLMRWKFTAASAKSMVAKPIDRSEPARALIEGFGGKLREYFFSFGEYDGVGIGEFPDNVSAAACSVYAASTGGFSSFETTPLLTAKEAEQAMSKAHHAKIGYTPPNA
jgi:uncharacterized protein with GYD domain